MAPPGPPALAYNWNEDEVASWLSKMSLNNEAAASKKQHITGHDLEVMSVEETQAALGSNRQAALQIKQGLSQLIDAHDIPDTYRLPDQPPTAPETIPVYDTAGALPPSHSPALDSISSFRYRPNDAVSLDKATLLKYVSSLEIIKAIQDSQVELMLPAQEAKLRVAEDLLKCKQTEYDQLSKQVSFQKSKLAALGGTGLVAKLLMSQESQEQNKQLKLTVQKQLEEAKAKFNAFAQVRNSLAADVDVQRATVAKIKAQTSQLAEARQFESNVSASLFEGPAGDQTENAMEAAAKALLPQLDAVRKAQASFSRARELVRGAQKKLESAQDSFSAAGHLNKVDWVARKFVGLKSNVVTDLARQSHVQQGVALAKSAIQDLLEAKQMIPDLPKLDLQQLAQLQAAGLHEPYSGSITTTEKENQRHLASNIKELKKLDKPSDAAASWLDQWLDKRISQDLAKLEADYAVRKNQLDAYRRELLHKELVRRGLVAA